MYVFLPNNKYGYNMVLSKTTNINRLYVMFCIWKINNNLSGWATSNICKFEIGSLQVHVID